MEIRDIEAVLSEALEKKDDQTKAKYADAIAEYLKSHKSSDELVSIVVKGIDLDRAANYFDYVEGVSKNDLQSVWKQVRENKDVAANKENNGLKLVTGLLGLAFMKVGNMESQSGNIITKIVAMVSDDKKPIVADVYTPVILDYFVNDVADSKSFPGWDTFRLSGETNKKFAELLLRVTSGEHEEKYKNIRQWAANGVRLAEKQMEKEQLEAKIPKSKTDDLLAIVEHYKTVEKQVRDSVYEIARLEGAVKGLQDEVEKLNGEKHSLEIEIKNLQGEIEDQKKAIAKAEEEVSQRKDINDAFSALKENDEKAILSDIANALKTDYKNFKMGENEPMDAQLGEMYKELIRGIFKILDKKGIRME